MTKKVEDESRIVQRERGAEYYFGKESDKDLNKAVYWLSLAAENGDVIAADLLGMIYRYGEDDIIPADLLKCAHFFELAWKAGSESSLKSFIEVSLKIYSSRVVCS